MSSRPTVYLILFLTCLSSVAAGVCYNDLKFTVSARKESSSWVAKGTMDYNITSGSNAIINSNDGIANQDPFALDVSVDECSHYCPSGPYVRITASAKKISPRALPDYEHFEGVGYYKYHTTPTTWDEARRICDAEGTHLAIINSEKEAEIFGNYVTNVKVEGSDYKDYAYIGFHDRFILKEFLTIFNEPLKGTGFYRWSSPFEPNDYNGTEWCGSVHQNGGLNDIFCTLNQPFICEQELC